MSKRELKEIVYGINCIQFRILYIVIKLHSYNLNRERVSMSYSMRLFFLHKQSMFYIPMSDLNGITSCRVTSRLGLCTCL